jgi:drug/metabolite transporter (DMT)-like permease
MASKTRFPIWVAYALGSFFCYGITNSLLGALVEWSHKNPSTPITAPFVLWITMGFVGVCAAVSFKVTGRGFKGLPSRKFVWVAIVAGITLSAAMLTLKLGLSQDASSRGPIVAISSANAMLVAIGAWFIIKEKLNTWQLGGMLVIVAGIIVIGLSSGTSASTRALLYALATLVLFGITNFLLKYAGHHGSNSVTTAAILWLSSGVCGVLAIGFCLIRYGHLPGLQQPSLILWAILAGITLGLGMLCLKLAVTKGPGGPATAITGSNSVLVALFEYFVFAHVPVTQKLAGMGVAVLGIIVLSLAGSRKAAAAGPAYVAVDRQG